MILSVIFTKSAPETIKKYEDCFEENTVFRHALLKNLTILVNETDKTGVENRLNRHNNQAALGQ